MIYEIFIVTTLTLIIILLLMLIRISMIQQDDTERMYTELMLTKKALEQILKR